MYKNLTNFIIIGTFSMIFAQEYYTVDLYSTGVSQPTIFSNSISSLQVGDEIGVFDNNGISENCIPELGCTDATMGSVLVGSAVWNGDQVTITYWTDFQ